MRDVAQVRDGYMPQQNVVRQDGVRSTLLSILKSGSASTLGCRRRRQSRRWPAVMKTVHGESAGEAICRPIAVREGRGLSGVVREGVIAAALTALMILLFLGSWRSTLIIAISIPLSVLASLADAERAGRNDQSDDAGRPGAGGRHPGG